jgi:membrane protein YdbS with pleckstrin-like domain
MWILLAAVNVSISLFFVGEQAREWWLAGAVLAVVATIVTVLDGPNLARLENASDGTLFMPSSVPGQ